MRNIFRTYFHYSNSERNGFLVLALLCIFAILAPLIYNSLQKNNQTDFSEFQQEIQEFKSIEAGQKSSTKILNEQNEMELFTFNPNLIDAEGFAKLGLSQKVIQTLLNYRSAGGRFTKKEDLKKVYGLKDTDYDRLKNWMVFSAPVELSNDRQPSENDKNNSWEKSPAPTYTLTTFDPNVADKEKLIAIGFPERAANNLLKFREKGGRIREKEDLSRIYGISEEYYEELFPFIEINLAEKEPNKKEPIEIKSTVPTTATRFDLNAANVEDLQKLRGIGPALSKRIIKFRDRLGGFHSIDQVGETYGLQDSVLQSIKPFLKLEKSLRKINLNTAEKQELADHPYLNKKQAQLIINYRLQHGAFENIDSFLKIRGLPTEVKEKILPYLSLD